MTHPFAPTILTPVQVRALRENALRTRTLVGELRNTVHARAVIWTEHRRWFALCYLHDALTYTPAVVLIPEVVAWVHDQATRYAEAPESPTELELEKLREKLMDIGLQLEEQAALALSKTHA